MSWKVRKTYKFGTASTDEPAMARQTKATNFEENMMTWVDRGR